VLDYSACSHHDCFRLIGREPTVRRGGPLSSYLNLTTFVTWPWQRGHSNVRRSWPGFSGSMRASHISPPQSPQMGRSMTDSEACGTN
jgi:hypothetical protein